MLKNMPRGVVTFCPPGQPILGTCVFGSPYVFYDNRFIFRVLAFLLFTVPGRPGT